MTSPKLNEEENAEWLRLQRQKYIVSEEGFISERFLDEYSESRIRYLDKKAFG